MAEVLHPIEAESPVKVMCVAAVPDLQRKAGPMLKDES
jgi:hypothetical protein